MRIKSKEIDEDGNLHLVAEAECSDCTELKKNTESYFTQKFTLNIGDFLANHFWLMTDEVLLDALIISRYTDDFKNLPVRNFKDKEDCREKHRLDNLFCQQVVVNKYNREYDVHVRGKTIEAMPHYLSIVNAVRDHYREKFNLPSLWVSSNNSTMYAFWKQPDKYMIKKGEDIHYRDLPTPTYDLDKEEWVVDDYTDEVKEFLHGETFNSLVKRTNSIVAKLNKENRCK